MLPKLLFLSFLVGSLTSSSRTISKSFLLSRIDFVDDDDDDEEEEEEDKPSSPDSSDAKKSEKQQRQTKRTRRRERTRSRENNALFQSSFRCDSSACNLYVLFEFFSLQRFSLSLIFRVYNPNWKGAASGRLFPHTKRSTFSALFCPRSVGYTYSSIDILSRIYTILRSLRGVLLARALEE